MNMKHINVVLCIGLLLLCAFIASVANAGASVTELNVNPSVAVPGETLSISGKATSNEEVWLKSSFVISLPVSEDTYSEEFNGIHFPAGKKTFSVRAENIKDIRVSLGPILFMTVKYPLDEPKKATNGIATISISLPVKGIDVAGKKNVRVYGAALEDASSVILTTDMAIKVTADEKGDFKLDLDTGGVPLGEFSIAAGGKEKTVQIVRTKPKPTVFDTGSPEYPYPSMCGTHNGTLTPNRTITVSQLYTYSCPGTCGHTERVTIWNDMGGVIVDANWTGYRGDWRNITFDAVTLVAGETYNYSICTGSYPQIIHERTANVTGGTIRCAQFTDANGKVYIDWFPAIILLNMP
ncbi:MAG: hypothetical protein WBB08_05075 [Halobacteriota archaeon]